MLVLVRFCFCLIAFFFCTLEVPRTIAVGVSFCFLGNIWVIYCTGWVGRRGEGPAGLLGSCGGEGELTSICALEPFWVDGRYVKPELEVLLLRGDRS